MNQSPTLEVRDKTFSGTLQSFEVIGYVHNSKQKRKKLYDKSIKCVHLELSSESKAYRIYNPITKKIIVNRDVFVENERWEWNKNELETRESLLD